MSKNKKEKIKKAAYDISAPIKKTKLVVTFNVLKKFFSVLITTMFSLLLIATITTTIVATAVTIYILDFMDTSSDVSLVEPKSSYSSYIYLKNKATEEFDLIYKRTPSDHEVQIPVSIEEIPEHVKDAFVCTEDERFYSHDGVDYKRTAAVLVNLFIPIYDQKQGGSTITQQLIKNVTLDNELSWERKVREIFRALNFEQKYTKDDILEGYLNTIYFGQNEDYYNLNGIEAASIGYFGKSVSELTIREAASLAATPKFPNNGNPMKNLEANQTRAEYTLRKMFELAAITAEQYEATLNEKVLVSNMPEFKALYPNAKKINDAQEDFKNPEITPYYLDAAIYEFIDYLMEKDGLTHDEANEKFNSGGYKLYLTIDTDMQAHLDAKYANWDNFFYNTSDKGEAVQSSFMVMDYKGRILGLAGGIGEKTESLSYNMAVQANRQPGSTIKPITTYGYALEQDYITWSTLFNDTPIMEVDGKPWPQNYGGISDKWGYSAPVVDFIRFSRNTVPAQICDKYGVENVFNFAKTYLHVNLKEIYTAPDGRVISDVAYAPLSVGALSEGLTVKNLANAYMPFGNGGLYYKGHVIDKIVDVRNDKVILDNSAQVPEQAVSPETAFIMNRLLNAVTTDGTAPGLDAKIPNKNVVGKTGTSENWNDLTFVGLTEDFVSAMWLGYTNNGQLPTWVSSADVWYRIIGQYANNYQSEAKYPECKNVFAAKYCTTTGLIASSSCPHKSAKYGYYKNSNAPYCGH